MAFITNALLILFLTLGAKADADAQLKQASFFTSVDETEVTIVLYNQSYMIKMFPQTVLEDWGVDLFTVNIVKEMLGQDAFENDENIEEILAQISSVIRKRLDLVLDPRQIKENKLVAPRNDLLFSINVTFIQDNKVTDENPYYQ